MKKCLYLSIIIINELIPKLKIEFCILKFRMINRVSDPEKCSETLIDVKVKIGFGISS